MSALSYQHVVRRYLAEATVLDEFTDIVLNEPPVAYWKMDEASGLPQDSSASGLHMTAVSGSPTYQAAAPFDGATSISYPSAAYHERAVVSTLTNNFTWEAWVRRNGNTSGTLFQHGTTSGGFIIEFTSTAGATRGNLPGVGTLGATGTLPDGVWSYLVIMRNAGTWQSYLNAALFSSFGSAAPGTPVGNDRIRGSATSVQVAHMAWYNTVLTPFEITLRYLVAIGQVVRRTS